MTSNGKINWLASYPKSGNTWVRVFLANLLSESNSPVDINDLSNLTIASNRQLFDNYVGLASSDLDLKEIERLRPFVYDSLSDESTEQRFMKIHDAFIYTSEGRVLVSEKASNKALYIIRNPLDVAVSFAHHLHVTCEKSVSVMSQTDYAFCDKTDKLPKQLEQRLLSWSMHVESWTDQKIVPVKVVKYEDLLSRTAETFKEITDFFDLHPSNEKFIKAIEFSSFGELQKQETEKGFREKSPKAKSFFRKGIIGSWRDELSQDLIEKVCTSHKTVMDRFGYNKKD